MKGSLVLVTGATGFAGGHLCRRLVGDGHRVRALVRDASQEEDLRRQGIEPVLGDLRDKDSLDRAVADVETVYHIAASYREGRLSRQEMFATNVQGTRNLLDAAIAARVERFIHCSTIGVHGSVEAPPANEEAPFAPGDDYQDSKAQAERLVLENMTEGRIPIVVFRPAGIYGPGDLRFLKLFKAIQSKKFIMIGSGEVLYHVIYIDDLIDGIISCANQERAIGNVYILAGSEPVTLNRLVQMVAAALDVRPPRLRIPFAPVYLAGWICELVCKPLGINPPLYRRRVDFFRKTRSFDISKAKKELGFAPKTDLRAGIELTAKWYRGQGLLPFAVAGVLSSFFFELKRHVGQHWEIITGIAAL